MNGFQSLVLASLLSGASIAHVQAETGVRIERDLVYATADGLDLKLDLYLPPKAAAAAEAPPLVVWIHGGGWESGDKARGPMLGYVAAGYAAASINYRLSQQATFPAQIHDCKAAIRWLRAKAAQFGYDADRIGVTGGSAGGHLASLLGTTNGNQDLEGELGEHVDTPSDVHAVVNLYGPAHFTRFSPDQGPVFRLLGGSAELGKLASPTTHVSAGDPPFLILHGTADRVVPVEQSRILHERLTQAGVESELIVLDGAGHGGEEFFAARPLGAIAKFLERHLREK